MSDSEIPSSRFTPPVRGRGAGDNPAGRFESRRCETDAETFNALYEAGHEAAEKQVPTEFLPDRSRTIVTTNDSPDLGMDASLNPYRGCEHGCIYCYARPTHEYLGYSAGIDFESRILVKEDAPALLREKLSSPRWRPRVLVLSGVTDPYQPVERRLELTRDCLAVLRDFRNPGAIITKNHLVTRDRDILGEMARHSLIQVNLSITTLDRGLARVMEPRTSRPDRRLQAIRELSEAGVPTGVMIGPVLPGLTDHELPAILEAAAEAGAISCGYTMLRLPHGVKDLFRGWLETHYPERAGKVLRRLREMHGGQLYDSRFGSRMRGSGLYADHVANMFALYRKRHGLDRGKPLSLSAFRRPAADGQMDLF